MKRGIKMKRKFFAGFLALLLSVITVVVSPVEADATIVSTPLYLKEICIGYGEEGRQMLTDAGYTVLCDIEEVNDFTSGDIVYLGYSHTFEEKEALNNCFRINVQSGANSQWAYIRKLSIGYGEEGTHRLMYDGLTPISCKSGTVVVKFNEGSSEDVACLGYKSINSKSKAINGDIFYVKITRDTSSIFNNEVFNWMFLVYFAVGAVISGLGVWLVMRRKIKNMQK